MNYHETYADKCIAAKALQGQIHNPTVLENIDNSIAMHKVQIERLEAVRTKLAAGNIADIPLSDLRDAMSY